MTSATLCVLGLVLSTTAYAYTTCDPVVSATYRDLTIGCGKYALVPSSALPPKPSKDAGLMIHIYGTYELHESKTTFGVCVQTPGKPVYDCLNNSPNTCPSHANLHCCGDDTTFSSPPIDGAIQQLNITCTNDLSAGDACHLHYAFYWTGQPTPAPATPTPAPPGPAPTPPPPGPASGAVFDQKSFQTTKDCSGAPSTELKWVTGGKCMAGTIGGQAVGTTYTGTSCASGGVLSVYASGTCQGAVGSQQSIPATPIPATPVCQPGDNKSR
jgi:hypothetical protein